VTRSDLILRPSLVVSNSSLVRTTQFIGGSWQDTYTAHPVTACSSERS
jgi:hypothetical protein